MYLVPLVVGNPSCSCVKRPGCINAHPTFVSRTVQLYRVKRAPPPLKTKSIEAFF